MTTHYGCLTGYVGDTMKFSLGNLGGTLYFEDVPLFTFKYNRDVLERFELLVPRSDTRLPVEFAINKVSDDRKLHIFFEDRTTPETRIGLAEEMAKTPVQYYYPERIIRYSKGRCAHDTFWLLCDEDETCWK